MPELPEVETVVRGLRERILGARVAGVEVTLPRVALPDAGRLAAGLVGARVVACERRGKYVVARLEDGRALLVHLRMTGRLIYAADGDAEPPRHRHVTLRLEGGAALHFADARTFGRVRLLEPGEAWDAALGPEPLDPAFSVEAFAARLRGRRGAIKTVLLDQRVVAGVGNIYACEALWQARLAPEASAAALSPEAVGRLHAALRDVLERAIALRGTSARDYVDAEGLKGGFQNVLAVYGRHGLPCAACGAPIARTTLAQRGTWSCGACQPSPLYGGGGSEYHGGARESGRA